MPSVLIRTNSRGAEGHPDTWYDAEEAFTDDFLGPSALRYLNETLPVSDGTAERHPKGAR